MESAGNGIGWQWNRLARGTVGKRPACRRVGYSVSQHPRSWRRMVWSLDDIMQRPSRCRFTHTWNYFEDRHGAMTSECIFTMRCNTFARSENLALECNTLEYQIHQVKYIYWIKSNVKSRQTISFHRDRTLKESETSNNRSQTHIQERTPFFPKPTICFLLNSRTINCFKMTDNFCRLLRIPIIQDVLIRILLPDNSYWVKGALANRRLRSPSKFCRTSWPKCFIKERHNLDQSAASHW